MFNYFASKNMNQCAPIVSNELETSISVNSLTDNPEQAWEQIESQTSKIFIEPLKLDQPIHDNKVINLVIK